MGDSRARVGSVLGESCSRDQLATRRNASTSPSRGMRKPNSAIEATTRACGLPAPRHPPLLPRPRPARHEEHPERHEDPPILCVEIPRPHPHCPARWQGTAAPRDSPCCRADPGSCRAEPTPINSRCSRRANGTTYPIRAPGDLEPERDEPDRPSSTQPRTLLRDQHIIACPHARPTRLATRLQKGTSN